MIKLCECGCGQPVSISPNNNKKNGYIKGQPRRFCVGHYIKLHHIKTKRFHPPVEERFWKHVNKTDECWIWTGCKKGNGYGAISVNGKQEGAHRLSWMLANGEIPKGMLLMHSCDNPVCVNPNHLSLGSIADNSKDMARKGRAASKKNGKFTRSDSVTQGENNGSAVLTELDVRKIREMYSTGKFTMKKIAIQYGVTERCIGLIISKKTWKHLE